MSGRDRERRKGSAPRPAGATAAVKGLLPPDKKKYEREVKEIGSQIKDLESQRKSLSSRGAQSADLTAELSKTNGRLAEIGQQKQKTTTEARKLEDQIKRLGPEISSKKDEASRLLAGLRYKSKERIEDAVSKLRQQLLTRQYSGTEERKLQSEIDNLEASKSKLQEYLSTKSDIDCMIEEQEQLRERRNSLYRISKGLRSKEGEVKDEQEALRKRMDELRDKKKDIQSQKDALTKEIDELHKARQKLSVDFRRAQAEFLTATSQLSQQETEEKERESMRREEERKARRRRQMLEAEMQREMQFDEEKTTCKTLILHMQKLLDREATTTTASSNGIDVTVYPQRSQSSPAAPSTGPTPNARLANADREMRDITEHPGEFLPRKGTDDSEYLVPTSSRKRSKRDKKRHALSGRAPRRLHYDPMVLSQFSFLSISPPTTHSHIEQVLQTLREKLAFYEHKTAVCSEAGDSGIGSQALGDVEQEFTCNSQEECDPTSLSPKRNSIDSHSPSSLVPSDPPQHQNSNGLSPPSTPIISSSTVDPKILQHSLSTSTNASSTSTSALLPVNDE